MSLVEQELLILPEHLSSLPIFSGVRVTRSLVLYVCFVDCPLCCLFFLNIRILIGPWLSSNSSITKYILCIMMFIEYIYSMKELFLFKYFNFVG